MLCQKGREGATDQGHIGQQVGMAAAGTVLPKEHIAPPMISQPLKPKEEFVIGG
jgi:hypothetical protein